MQLKLLKTQLAESRSKCELLEQSLRVIAQENHDLEVKTLKDNTGNATKQVATPSTMGTVQKPLLLKNKNTIESLSPDNQMDRLSIDSENNQFMTGKMKTNVSDADEDDSSEEFFDIEDTLTDEGETDSKSENLLDELEESDSSRAQQEQRELSELKVKLTENELVMEKKRPESDKIKHLLPVDANGWRLVHLIFFLLLLFFSLFYFLFLIFERW
jgi:hypothetical protein